MDIIQAIVLGIIQGLTEFLPISSSAHLRIFPALLGWDDPGAAFTAIIQIGTLAAVLIYFYQDILRITSATISGLVNRNPFGSQDSRMGWMISAGTIPIVVLGLLFKKNIETTFRSLYIISGSLILLALVLMYAEYLVKKREARGEKMLSLDKVDWKEAIIIGLAQSLALIPGSSRSGTTITGGLFLGMTRETAARFSFLLSLPAVFAAGVYQLLKVWPELMASGDELVNLTVATVVSGVIGYASIAFLLDYLKKHSTYLFIIYRILLGVFLLAMLSMGKLEAF
ncbi:undecaprenol kinase [Chloroherpeton thalassium ATCC 35110]|uniref:Undecaprenyl-diphosphatase n=1 Tax=Chloroherpeton thalassium (strain ATCC 35110 / GB-78) TaxID=517418 RepID=UPPP_CHLT3|nr:undecaprenyl-diphosphate phosphatase [Chloroherpeton thalassium]B3QW96.1 RecName: Full=Undecaprenyl-diphosphatase; AltName: Full=Bacitracin resistance protein; AltName: Full=Undecaprenyl pyrophosphate phosphatase [Chloroherpeton thalassium ATCC 35110]ACF13209.1 undecaprenol kinase [Chloroherpeton thalassium ATCC 35110]